MHSSTSNSIDIVDHLVEANITPRAAGKQYVAIYIRYDDNDLKTSFQYQKEHYQAFLNKHPDWQLIGIYADEGLTEDKIAVSRAALGELLKACGQGRITMVITWTVTAFLPTIYDMLGWKPENRYRILGVRRQRGDEVLRTIKYLENMGFNNRKA